MTKLSKCPPPGSPRLVDSFTAPKDVLREFADLAEEENYDPFAETASKRQIASRQSDYHNRRFDRVGLESSDAFKDGEQGEGYKEAMRLQRLEREEARVRRAIQEKERQDREDGKVQEDLDRTPPAAEIEEAMKELAAPPAGGSASDAGMSRSRRKRKSRKLKLLGNGLKRRWRLPHQRNDDQDGTRHLPTLLQKHRRQLLNGLVGTRYPRKLQMTSLWCRFS